MNRIRQILGVAMVAGLLATPALANDYLTEGVDNARTGWVRGGEPLLTKANLPKMKMLWKTNLPSQFRVYHNLFSPLIAERVNTPSGVKEVAIVAGISDQLFGLDAKTGAVLWTKKFDYTANNGVVPNSNDRLCPGGQTAMPTMEKLADGSYKVWALSGDGRLWQVNAATGADIAAPIRFAPDNGKSFALNKNGEYIYTSLSQGCGGNLHQIPVYNTRTQKVSVFYPQGGGLWGRRGVAIDSKGNAWMGTGDSAYRTEGALGNIVVAVKPDADGMLQLTGQHAAYNVNWMWKRDMDINVSPLIANYRGKEFMIETSKECRLHLVDVAAATASPKGTRASLDITPLICNDRQLWDEKGVWGSLAAGGTSDGQYWVFVPFWGEKSREFNPPIVNTPKIPDSTVADNQLSKHGGVAAFTINQVSGKWRLTPRWLSQDMDMGEEGMLVNDIFWVYASGVNARQQGREIAWNDTTTPFGSPKDMSSHVTIYALDARTGKTLWSSGDQITSWNHFSGITVANGKVYVGTYDGTVWCFGIES